MDLGNLSVACMTQPETCDNGGTVTLWVKLLEVGGFQGIITSLDIPRSDGFTFYLSDSILGYACQITTVISSLGRKGLAVVIKLACVGRLRKVRVSFSSTMDSIFLFYIMTYL